MRERRAESSAKALCAVGLLQLVKRVLSEGAGLMCLLRVSVLAERV